MKLSVLVLVLLLLFCGSRIRAQDSTHTRWDRIEYVVGASAIFSLADYIGYNFERVDNVNGHAAWWYVLLHGSLQAGISYFLYEKLGLPSAIAFNLIWWTWGDDLAYYGWSNVINDLPPPWESHQHNGLRDNYITWAGWTPIGLFQPQGTRIDRGYLIAQVMVGFSISMAIVW